MRGIESSSSQEVETNTFREGLLRVIGQMKHMPGTGWPPAGDGRQCARLPLRDVMRDEATMWCQRPALFAVLCLELMLIFATPAHPSEPGIESWHRAGAEFRFLTSILVHPREQNITAVCTCDHEVGGCTEFRSVRLECQCRQHEGGWFIEPVARIEAVIHLPNTNEPTPALAHELRHISRMEPAVGRHLETLAAHDYESEETCERMATFFSTSTHLRVVVNELAREENRKCGHHRPDRPKPSYCPGVPRR